MLLLTGCNSFLDPPTRTSTVTATPTTETSVSITPVTPDGLVTGPGVTDSAITLGVLIDPALDRGLSSGIQLWQQAVNNSGGLCGRTVELAAMGDPGVPADLSAAYDAIGRSVLGLISVPPPDSAVSVNSKISADQMPTLSPSGASNQLGRDRPIVVGPTADILAINALDYLLQAGKITDGATVGVLTDGSAQSDNALQGARWWAGEHGVVLEVRSVGSIDQEADLADWGPASTVFALTKPIETGLLAAALPSENTVVTTVDGYRPDQWDAPALAVAAAGRVLVSSATPAYGSDYPAAVAVAARAAATGVTPDVKLLDGYATGVSWARLLTAACAERTLTRQAVEQAALTVGPASVDGLFGPSDPALPVQSGLPATRVSAMSAGNPAAVTGLTPLTWLAGAANIEDYLP